LPQSNFPRIIRLASKERVRPLDIDRLFVFWLFHCAASGNFIAKITRSFHDSVLGDLASARNWADRTTGR
jgi:hypothetical protein